MLLETNDNGLYCDAGNFYIDPWQPVDRAIITTTKTNDKIAAMVDYFDGAPPADAVWAVYFLSGRRPKRLLASRLLRQRAAEIAGIPEWLLEESYGAVGDSAETAALLLPSGDGESSRPLHQWLEEEVLALRGKEEEEQRHAIVQAWCQLSDDECFVLNKLLTGSFRVGVSQRLLTRALAAYSGLDQAVIAHRLMGRWKPTTEFYQQLLAEETADADNLETIAALLPQFDDGMQGGGHP